MDVSNIPGRVVSITQFNKGKSSQLFVRAQNGEALVVLKNNAAIAVVTSCEEYKILRDLSKQCQRMIEQQGDHICTQDISVLLERLKAFDESGEKDV